MKWYDKTTHQVQRVKNFQNLPTAMTQASPVCLQDFFLLSEDSAVRSPWFLGISNKFLPKKV